MIQAYNASRLKLKDLLIQYFGFTNKLIRGETIKIFNYGNCKRNFTFVDDIVDGVKRVMQGRLRE